MTNLTSEDRDRAISEATAAVVVIMQKWLGPDCFDADLPRDGKQREAMLTMTPVERGILNASGALKDCLEDATYALSQEIDESETKAWNRHIKANPAKMFARDLV